MNFFKLTSLFLISAIPLHFSHTADQRPNVVVIVYDDMNGYGSLERYPAIQMPYLDKLKGQSINFINATCSVPVCNPSRASFLSGLQPTTNGAYLNGADIWDKPGSTNEHLVSLPEHFRNQGYLTWGAGKTFHSPMQPGRLERTFDVRPSNDGGFGPGPNPAHPIIAPGVQAWQGRDDDFPDVQNANDAIHFIQQKHEKPFFMFYGLWRPHSPYTAPKRFFEKYDPKRLPLPPGWNEDDLNDVPEEGNQLSDGLVKFKEEQGWNTDKWRKTLWGYCAASSFADWSVGRVIEAIDQSPYADNTIIILFSDNGYHCGEKRRWGKGTLWDASDYVPLLVRTPHTLAATSKRTVSLLDLYPTLVDLCGLESPDHELEGESFAHLLEDPSGEWTRPSFSVYGKHNASIRGERYHYILYQDGTEELYDTQRDPHEFKNLAANPSFRHVMDDLASFIPKAWEKSWGGRWEVGRPEATGLQPPEPR